MIILNGGSSSGKTRIARCLQNMLAEPWLAYGIDSFIEALPARMQTSDLVHEGMSYDLEVDTTQAETAACARIIAASVS
jgi:chloramphenicol 3-O phosphotransferase